jgi:hypothetical protein
MTKKRKERRKLATIDCETDPFLHGREPRPFLWDIFDGEKHWVFEHTSDAVHFLLDKRWVVYAHNGGKYDYLMPGFLSELNTDQKISVINGRLAKFKMGECEFRDSVNILPIKLADFQKDKIDYAWFERGEREKHMPEIAKYLRGDTEYLYRIVRDFRETYGDGLTLAGSAMKFWQAFCNVEAPKSTPAFYERFSSHYYGGRCECFHVGLINRGFSMFDINSAYPRAMMDRHPFSLVYGVSKPGKSEAIIPQSMYTVHAESDGALPYRDSAGALTFPKRRDLFKVTGWELLAGLETGTVKICEVLERFDFEETLHFQKYIRHFYDMKARAGALKKEGKGGESEYIFAKLMMNSLYGKFGSNPNEYANFYVVDPASVSEKRGEGYEWTGDLGGFAVMERELEDPEKRFFNVATAASVTGWVRAFLWRQICAVREAGGRVLYCDTDSIACEGGRDAFEISKELGDWSHEGDFVSGGIGGKKLYAFEGVNGKWKKSCKGADLTPKQILNVCQGEIVEYKRDAPTLHFAGMRDKDGEKISTGCRFLSRNVRLTGKASQ